MQLSQNVLVAILATLVAADGPGDFVSQLPSCSLACFQTGIAATSCKVADYACQRDATNMETINNIATPCLVKACSSADAESKSIRVIPRALHALSLAGESKLGQQS